MQRLQEDVLSGKNRGFLFHMPEIVALGTMIDIHCAVTTIQKSTQAIGKIVQNADNPSKQKYMFGTEQTSIILRNLRIRLLMNPRNVFDAELSLI